MCKNELSGIDERQKKKEKSGNGTKIKMMLENRLT